MSKRLTDTEKWSDDWFGSLPNDYRIVWLYLVDRCNHAGIWKKDFRGLNFNCNTNLSEVEIKTIFNGRLVDCGNFFFIPKFIKFQYSMGLSSNKPVIISVVKELKANNLLETVTQSLGNDYLIIKSKSKDIDKDNDIDKSKSIEKEKRKDKASNPIAENIIRYTGELTGKSFLPTNKTYQKHINARLREGYTEDQLREVVEYKVAEWTGIDMERYLVPDTLFNRDKFPKYIDQVQTAKNKGLTIQDIKPKKNGLPNEGLAEAVAKLYAAKSGS